VEVSRKGEVNRSEVEKIEKKDNHIKTENSLNFSNF